MAILRLYNMHYLIMLKITNIIDTLLKIGYLSILKYTAVSTFIRLFLKKKYIFKPEENDDH